MALLTLHERSRDWKAAIEVARQLEAVAAGSFRASPWPITGANWRSRPMPEARVTMRVAALDKARQAAPQAARPRVLAGQRAARAGAPREACRPGCRWWRCPGALSVIAAELAASAQACGRADEARVALSELHRQVPTSDLLAALLALDADPASRRRRLLDHMKVQPGLGPVLRLLREPEGAALSVEEHQAVQGSVAQALLRCSATAARPAASRRSSTSGSVPAAGLGDLPAAPPRGSLTSRIAVPHRRAPGRGPA